MTTVDVKGFIYPSCSNGGLRSRLYWEEIRDIQSVIMVVDLGRINDLNIIDTKLPAFDCLKMIRSLDANPDRRSRP